MDGLVENLAAKLAATKARAMTPEPADHGLSERRKLSPLQAALNPSYPETYLRMGQDARNQMSYSIDQVSRPETDQADPPVSGLSLMRWRCTLCPTSPRVLETSLSEPLGHARRSAIHAGKWASR
jgi:hypothetical protein